MARERGEAAGQSIGYATRLDSKVGKATRIVNTLTLTAGLNYQSSLASLGTSLPTCSPPLSLPRSCAVYIYFGAQ